MGGWRFVFSLRFFDFFFWGFCLGLELTRTSECGGLENCLTIWILSCDISANSIYLYIRAYNSKYMVFKFIRTCTDNVLYTSIPILSQPIIDSTCVTHPYRIRSGFLIFFHYFDYSSKPQSFREKSEGLFVIFTVMIMANLPACPSSNRSSSQLFLIRQ